MPVLRPLAWYFCPRESSTPTHSSMLLIFIFLSTLLSALFSICESRQPLCDPRTKPPTEPSFQDCQNFLEVLSIRAQQEPPGTFKYYGRNIGSCDECVELPTIIFFKGRRCAALIDVFDKQKRDISIFDLRDLRKALGQLVSQCWLGKRQNGVGFPGDMTAWAGFIRAPGSRSTISRRDRAIMQNRTEDWEKRNISVLDLSEGWTEQMAG